MAIQTDFDGLSVKRLAKLTAVDMTTAAVYNVLNNGPNTLLMVAWTVHNFSAFNDGVLPPATWACSMGTNSTTAPNNFRAASALTSVPLPETTAFTFNSTTLTPYIPPFKTFYFAVTTTTNGVGTFDVTFYGGILAK